MNNKRKTTQGTLVVLALDPIKIDIKLVGRAARLDRRPTRVVRLLSLVNTGYQKLEEKPALRYPGSKCATL